MALALLLGVSVAKDSSAADWAIVPSVTARTEFDTNLNYSFIAPKSDYIFSLSPAAAFNYTTDIAQLQGKLGLTGRHYLSNGQIDHIDQDFEINGWYQVTPRWKLSLNTAYISDTSLYEELITSGLVMTRSPRDSILAAPAVTYAVTERLSATFNYSFNNVNYPSQLYQNYTSQQTGLLLQQQLKNEKTTLIGNFLANQTDYPSLDNHYKYLGFYLGADHKFSPDWEITLMGGVNLTFMDFHSQVPLTQFPFVIFPQLISPQPVIVHQTSAQPYVNLYATKRWTNFTVTGGYSRTQSPSAYGTISDTNQFFLALAHDFTERWSGSLSGYYTLSNQISQTSPYRSSFLSLSPQLSYRLTENLTLSPGYQFGQNDAITSNRIATGQTVWLMLTYVQPSIQGGVQPPTPVGTMPAPVTTLPGGAPVTTLPGGVVPIPPRPNIFGITY
jgi:hypothetical protein